MPQAFLTPDTANAMVSEVQTAVTLEPTDEPNRETVRILVRGSSVGVQRVVHELYRVGFAEVHEWSKPQPTGQTNEVMRILTRYVFVD